jgi:hypothetical protein
MSAATDVEDWERRGRRLPTDGGDVFVGGLPALQPFGRQGLGYGVLQAIHGRLS